MAPDVTVRKPDWIEWFRAHADHAARDRAEYELHLAAHEWALGSSLDINSRKDFQSLKYLAVEPFSHQVEDAILFFRRLAPRGLIADDVGLGKTITAGLIAAELLERGRIESILVVCPKPIIFQWEEELRTKFGIKAEPAVGQQFESLKSKPHWITTYATARSKMALIKNRNFDLIVLDEAHALRNLYQDQPPQVALRFRELMVKEGARYVLMLTATPIHNRLWDIYSLLDICRTPQPNPLGSPQYFSATYIADHPTARKLRAGTRDDFRRRVAEATIRTRRGDTQLLFPSRDVKDERLTPNPDEKKFLEEALAAILQLPPLAQITHARTLMSSPWAAAAAFEGASTRTQYSAELRQTFAFLASRGRQIRTSAKIDRVLNFATQLKAHRGHPRLIVFTTRIETLNHLHSALSAGGFADQISIFKGGQDQLNRRAVSDFMEEPPVRPILLSTDAGAVGLNLQAGNVVINYDLPWNPMLIEQRIGRVQRLGQRAEKVIVYNLVLSGTIEDRIVLRLMEKLSLFNQAIGEMEALLEAMGLEDDDNGSRSMEDVIIDLIRKSANQIDVESQLERMSASRKEAEGKLKEMREATDTALKSLKPEDGETRLTGLPRVQPRLELETFVQRLLERRFPEVRVQGEGRFAARDGVNWRSFVIGRAAVQGAAGDGALPLSPGTRHFEQLTEPLRSKVAHHVLDGRHTDLDKLRAALSKRATCVGLVFEDLEVNSTTEEAGVVGTAKVTARVSTDQFETLISASHSKPEHLTEDLLAAHVEGADTGLPILTGLDREWAKHMKSLTGSAEKGVLDTEGVKQFCEFYIARREEEQQRLRAQPGLPADAARRAKEVINFRFSPEVSIDPVSIAGIAYQVAYGKIRLRGREQREAFPLPFSGVPLTGAVVSFPEVHAAEPWVCPGHHVVERSDFLTCVVEGCTRGSCHSCLSTVRALASCGDCTAQLCEAHRLACQSCRKTLCPEHAWTMDDAIGYYCSACTTVLPDGRRVLASVTVESAVSRRRGLRRDMVQSAVSNKWGFPEELVECEETRELIFPDERVVCDVTGKRVSVALTEESAVSRKRALRSRMQRSPSGAYFLPTEGSQCEETGEVLAHSEIGRCTSTGKTVRKDLLGQDDVSGDLVLKRLLQASDVSGRSALPDHVRRSDLSGRIGIVDELKPCGVCGSRILLDEGQECAETGLFACKQHFVKCEVSGLAVLPDGLARCEASGKLVARSLLSVCPDSSKLAMSTLFEKCERTGVAVLPEALARSEVSGVSVRKRLLVPCEHTGRLALPDEMETCAVSGKRVLPSVLIECPESHSRILPEDAVACQSTGALCHPTGLAKCEVTSQLVRRSLLATDEIDGQQMLASLTARCDVSGRVTRADRLVTCTVSGRRSVPELMSRCAMTGRPVLPEKLEACDLTNSLVHPDLLCQCPETGRRLLKQSAKVCEVTGDLLAPDGAGTCAATNKTVRRSLLAVDEVSHAQVMASLLQTCEQTNRRTLAEHLVRSSVSGKQIIREIAAMCAVSGAHALPEELGTCALSGERVLPSLMGQCAESGDPVARHRLWTCEASSVHAKPEHFGQCVVTGKRVLKRLLKPSELSGGLALEDALQICSATGRKLLPSEIFAVELGGKRVEASRVVHCHVCGRTADKDDTKRCSVCDQRTCRDHTKGGFCSSCETLLIRREGSDVPFEDASVFNLKSSPYRAKRRVESTQFSHLLLTRFRLFGRSEERVLVSRRGEKPEKALTDPVLVKEIASELRASLKAARKRIA